MAKTHSYITLKPAPYHKELVLSLALVSAPLSSIAFAEDELSLDTINVIGQTTHHEKKHDVTGLGSLDKNDFYLQESQVENIRDLTRYDPGISANEAGGRGASRGFAIRGVEKERVAMNVDGLNSAPILRRDDRNSGSSPSRSSSSINEVEYENLKLVNIRKGSSSSEVGSGALGGAISMTTKDTDDFFFEDDDTFAGRLKAGYTSKDKRKMLSAAIAARQNGWEGFVQYTVRDGHEIRAHSDLYKNSYTIKDPYLPDGKYSFNSENVSGSKRKAPNPLDFDSHSFLSKGGYHLNNSHYVGLVLEDTQHNYSMRDMFVPNYHSNDVKRRLFAPPPTPNTIKFTPTRHYIDQHQNKRVGFEYKYRPQENNSWLDQADIRLDWRHLELSTDTRTLNCAPWPTIDKTCWPKRDQLGQLGIKTFVKLNEKDVRLDTDLIKTLNWGNTQHQLRLHAGIISSKYRVDDEYHKLYVQSLNKKPNIKEEHTFDTTGKMTGKNLFISLSDKMTLSERLEASVGLRYDHQSFKANPSVRQRQRGMIFTGSSFENLSWDAGVAYEPFDSWKVAYRVSSGFRVPSIIEQIGPYFNTTDLTLGGTQEPLDAEKSLNQEIGLEYNSPILRASGSYFITKYSDIIDRVSIGDENGHLKGYPMYLNSQNFTTHGFDIEASVNTHALWNKLPDGLELFGKVGVTKIKKASELDDRIVVGSTYSFDAIQPLRLIYGAHYHAPNEKWGVSLLNTYSKAKDLDELTTQSRQGGLKTKGGTRFAKLRSSDWWITDLTGYYNVNDDITLRAGIYNLFDFRYFTWESVRQTSFGSEANINTDNFSSLVAPGRNFLLNFEIRL